MKSLAPPYPEVLTLIREAGDLLPATAIAGDRWTLAAASAATFARLLEAKGVPLHTAVKDALYYGIKTGLNEAFIIDAETRKKLIGENSECERVIKPLLLGDDIRKWRVERYDKWLLYMHHGVEVRGLRAVLNHLRKFKKQLEARATNQEWYELQQPQHKYAMHFADPKIVFPDIAKESRFTLDTKGAFIGNTAYALGTDDLFVLGVLNSRAIWEYAKATFSCLGDPENGGRFRFIFQFVSKIPIPNVNPHDRKAIATFVEACLESRGKNCNEAESEIDARVEKLFGISETSVKRSTRAK